MTARTQWLLITRQGGLWEGRELYANSEAVFDYIRHELPPSAVIASLTPEEVYLYTGRKAVPLVPESDRLAERLGRLDLVTSWMAEAPGCPFYLLSHPPDRAQSVDAKQSAALSHHPALEVREVFRSPCGHYWLGRVALKG